ncbi:hypothetical protein VTN00DRAFT_1916 [Thermoascus crustaceus]|uniref:uncharacterized protein n=1 Tax=Thermoascus crustaceus TaxID=5088 RepID=UPI003743147C
MGIQGLHGLLKSIQKPSHLKKLSGQTLGVDAYGWLHRGTVSCAIDLALDKPTTKHIEFALNRVRMLIYFGVTPYLVFDGDNLPSKSGTESDRQKRRDESKKLGLELYRKGRMAEAQQELQKAIDVTPYMARQLIEELKNMKIQYVVAPYEADAQLAYLERQGIINGIISEDSDLLVFGAKRLISKLDQHGDCIEINRSDFTACRDISLIGWTDADFRRMCILSGCDYLPSIPKMGLKTAYRNIRRYKNVEKVLRMLQFEGKYNVPADYLDNFKQAELTFLYQRVFCPKEGKLVTLTPLDDGVKVEEMPFIGADIDPEIAVGVACGDLDPMTKEPINLKPSTAGRLTTGITRRQTLSSTADLKPNKPISSFFTPKRVPLAELDPNSLTPSPSQQRLLERHANNSWETSPAPSQPSVTRSSSLRLSLPAGSPMVRSVERESFLARAARISTFQSAKRQRLCSDADEESLPDLKERRSRFFTSTDEQSPSGQKITRTKKARKSDFGVFSDDVAEEIMSQLPDVVAPTDSAKESASVAPGTNGSGDSSLPTTSPDPTNPSEAREETGQDTQATVSTEPSDDSNATQDSTQQTTPTTFVNADSDPELFNRVLEFHVQKQNSALLSKHTFKGNTNSTSSAHKGVSANKPTMRQGPGLKPSSSSPGLSRAVTQLKGQRLTPLQRLGQNALTKSRSMDRLGARTPVTGPRDSGYESDFGAGRPPVTTRAPNHRGSEDLLVPNSDDEDGDSRDNPRPNQPSLDLKRFSFTPK